MFLPQPRYFPPDKGRYSTTPDLKPLGTDYGNGRLDEVAFQFDEHTPQFLANKQGRVALTDSFAEIEAPVVAALSARLATEWPERAFVATDFNHFCQSVCEDIAIVRRSPERGDWNAAMHISTPSHWAPEEKIGQNYATTHAPVPGTERSRAAASSLVDIMVNRGPFVRFTWGLAFDDRLDCHPRHGKTPFDGENLWFRTERQILIPLPELNAAIFLIRLHLYPASTVPREPLRIALESMSPEARAYKGLADDWERVVSWLRTAAMSTLPTQRVTS
ncbi:heme-dependent oxidative N-demethylase subunit alpha family protein [Armatimonas sp.]|uniref:heme-dependent oxidative N-demethylase subunit alpha family protein n=1 Tax=Armatimonas sp. TaxID=1872638 RepID=UPI00286BF3A7|nr:heme-dependent oxidative N-demethylase subunit alpha family protein [Armatimonas sp.]